MKQLASITACLSLLAGVITITPHAQFGDSAQDPSESVLTTLHYIAPDAISPVVDRESATIVGAGWQFDFGCGVVTGVGFALTATGALAVVGIAVAGIGIACALSS